MIKKKSFLPPHTRKEGGKEGTKNKQSTIPSQIRSLSEAPSNGHSNDSAEWVAHGSVVSD